MAEVKAKLRYARVSAQKARLVVDMVRGKDVNEALKILTFTKKKTGYLVKKLLQLLFFLSLLYGAIGLFTSSLVKNQVVALIAGMIFCTFFFFIGQLALIVPLALTGAAEWFGVISHTESFVRGVWDMGDVF